MAQFHEARGQGRVAVRFGSTSVCEYGSVCLCVCVYVCVCVAVED